MKNPFTCDNCIFNPSQFQDIGTHTGFCLKHAAILRGSSQTTCRFHRRKDLPYFLAQEGETEHAQRFSQAVGVVYYLTGHAAEMRSYSERDAWLTRTFDPSLHDVAIYHRTIKKWEFLQALTGARSGIRSIMHSSMVRRYIFQCGAAQDSYRLVLALSAGLGEKVDLQLTDFRSDVAPEEFQERKESYTKDIILLRLYAVQEYGHLTNNENIMWASDELNGSFLGSTQEYLQAVRELVPVLQTWIIDSAQARGTFFNHSEMEEPEPAEPERIGEV